MSRHGLRGLVFLASFAAIALGAVPARAELVFFTTGRTMSVKSHRVEGDRLVLALREGGEVQVEASVIARIGPDEVPYPEPAPTDSASIAPLPSAIPAEYAAIVERVAAREGVNARLVKAVIQVESGYRPRARSPRGAMGLMQLMPETARQYAVADPYDPQANIEAGIKHLKALLQRFPLALALAAYNAGELAVERAGGIPPYGETRAYVLRILKLVGR